MEDIREKVAKLCQLNDKLNKEKRKTGLDTKWQHLHQTYHQVIPPALVKEKVSEVAFNIYQHLGSFKYDQPEKEAKPAEDRPLYN